MTLETEGEKQFHMRLDIFRNMISCKFDIKQLLSLIMILQERIEMCIKVMHRKQAQAFKTMRRSLRFLIEILDMFCPTSNKGAKEEQNYVYNALFTIMQSIKNISSESDFANEYEAIESRYKSFQNGNDAQLITFDSSSNESEIPDQIDMR